MKNIDISGWYQEGMSFLFMLIISISAASCHGQDHKNPAQSKINVNATADPNDDTTWVDPLFFIEGQLCQHLREIYQDQKGNLWLGANVYGLMRYDGDTLVYYDEKDGLGGGRITGIVEDTVGHVWFGTYGGLSKYDGSSFSNYSKKDGLLDNEIWCLLLDSQGITWIGTTEGVSRFDGKNFTTFPVPKARVNDTTTVFYHERITSVIEDGKGNIWFGTDGFGISVYDGNAFTHFTREDGLCDHSIYDMMVDTKGNVWIGTYFGGVSLYDGESFTNFTLDGSVSGAEVTGFFEDKAGNIWFAAENNGVYRYDGESFTNLYTEEGLVTNGILSIYQDREGRFWFGGWGGLFRYDGNSFHTVTRNGPWDR